MRKLLVVLALLSGVASSETFAQRRRVVNPSNPVETPAACLFAIPDSAGMWRAYFGTAFPATQGMVVSFHKRYDDGSRVEILPRIIVSLEQIGGGLSEYFVGGLFWGEALPEGVVALEADVEVSGSLLFSLIHPLTPGSGPLEDAKVDPATGRIQLFFKPGYYGYIPAPFVLGRYTKPEPGMWITPPPEPEYHGPNIPVTSCVGLGPKKIECSTLPRDTSSGSSK